jgi:hypothetical protein
MIIIIRNSESVLEFQDFELLPVVLHGQPLFYGQQCT